MKKHLNQRGYALLIVIITIIIFLSLASVVFTATLNTAKQENTVNNTNQSIVAAEMGLKKISKDIENELRILLPNLEKEYIKKISIINTDYLNEKVNLSISKNLLIDQNYLYYVDVTNLINGIITTKKSEYSKPIPTLVDLKPKQIIENEPKTYFFLKSITSNSVGANDLFKISIEVNGVKGNEKNIAADINLEVPRAYFNDDDRLRYVKEPVAFNVSEFFETPAQNCEDLTSMKPEDIAILTKPIKCLFDENATFEDAKKLMEEMYKQNLTENDFHFYIENFIQTICENSSDCKKNPFKNMENTTLFVLGDVPVKNINNSGGFQLYVNGTIHLMNALNYGDPNIHTVMLGKSLELKQLKAENTTFVLIGNEDPKGFFSGEIGKNLDPKLQLSADSKVCVNLDGFHSDYIKNFKEITGGKVYYFTSSNTTLGSNSIKVSSLNLLYETCNLTKFYSAEELGSLNFNEVKY